MQDASALVAIVIVQDPCADHGKVRFSKYTSRERSNYGIRLTIRAIRCIVMIETRSISVSILILDVSQALTLITTFLSVRSGAKRFYGGQNSLQRLQMVNIPVPPQESHDFLSPQRVEKAEKPQGFLVRAHVARSAVDLVKVDAHRTQNHHRCEGDHDKRDDLDRVASGGARKIVSSEEHTCKEHGHAAPSKDTVQPIIFAENIR